MARDRDFFLAVVLSGLSLTACGGDTDTDAGTISDAGSVDAGAMDAAASVDSGMIADAGFDAEVATDADIPLSDAGTDAFVAIL